MTNQFCNCGNPATKLCDGKVEGGTCDRLLCLNCVAQSTPFIACIRGKGQRSRSYSNSRDYCQECFEKRSDRQ